jgi:hypothetical protein
LKKKNGGLDIIMGLKLKKNGGVDYIMGLTADAQLAQLAQLFHVCSHNLHDFEIFFSLIH